MKRIFTILSLLISVTAHAQNSADFCIGNLRSPHSTITATSNSTIRLDSINCGGAATPAITIGAGIHDVHITKCWLGNSTSPNGLIYINSTAYNIYVDTCVITNGYRGIYIFQTGTGTTQNLRFVYNEIKEIADAPGHPNGGGNFVQFNVVNCTSGCRVDSNYCQTTTPNGTVGDQISLFKTNGTVGNYVKVYYNSFRGGSTDPTGKVAMGAGDNGGSYQDFEFNTIVNVDYEGFQCAGGDNIIMNNNTIFQVQTSLSLVPFSNYGGGTNITMSFNTYNFTNSSGSTPGPFFNTPCTNTGNAFSSGITSSILPNPLIPACLVPPVITYTSPNIFSVGQSVTLTPVNTGGAASSWGCSPTLPVSLSINSGTGVITGTLTSVAAMATYTVTATNTAGSGTFPLVITVVNTTSGHLFVYNHKLIIKWH